MAAMLNLLNVKACKALLGQVNTDSCRAEMMFSLMSVLLAGIEVHHDHMLGMGDINGKFS